MLAAASSILALGARGHWLMDLLANFRVQYALYLVAAAVLFFLCRNFRWAGITAVVAALNLWIIFPYLVPLPQSSESKKEGSESFRLMNFNVLSSNQRYGEVMDYMREQDADFVLFWRRVLNGSRIWRR